MIAGRFLAPNFFQNKMIEKMIVAEWSLTLVWNILTKWSLKWSLKNLDFEKISTILCMYTREIAYLHWKIGFQAVFMHVYTRNCIFRVIKLVFKLFLCMHTREIAYLHYKIGFQAVFMHLYTRNCVFTLENWFPSSIYACIHMKKNIHTKWSRNDRREFFAKKHPLNDRPLKMIAASILESLTFQTH